jgi:hypothetical protein
MGEVVSSALNTARNHGARQRYEARSGERATEPESQRMWVLEAACSEVGCDHGEDGNPAKHIYIFIAVLKQPRLRRTDARHGRA